MALGGRLTVLGADGFIGSHLTRAAAAAGITTIAVCVKDDWRLRDIQGIERVRVDNGEWWSASFAATLRRCLLGSDAIALLAYSPPSDRSAQAWERHERSVNLAGSTRVAELAAELGVRVLFASSADVYGTWHEEPIAESTALSPQTPYAEVKAELEALVDELAGRVGGSRSLRIATVFGPGENGPRAIPAFIRAYLGDQPPVVHGPGTDVRDYVHVRDVARAFLAACLGAGGPAVPGSLNVGSGVGRSTLQVLETVASSLQRPPEAQFVDSPRPPARLILDPRLAGSALDFRAAEEFSAGVAEEARWLEEFVRSSTSVTR